MIIWPKNGDRSDPVTLDELNYRIEFFTHLKLCLATAKTELQRGENYLKVEFESKIYTNLAILMFISPSNCIV